MIEFIIRDFTEEDTEAAKALIGELQAHEIPLQPRLQPWENVRDAFWAWLLSNTNKKSGFILIAEVDKTLIGLVAGWLDADEYPGFKREEWPYGYVSDLVVAPSARRKGVGEALMKAAEHFFANKGVKTLRLTAFANNKLADDFYVNYGMERYIMTYKKTLAGVV